MLKCAALALGLTLAASASLAADVEVVSSEIRAMLPNQPSASAYLELRNDSGTEDRLIGASSPDAESVEFHDMSLDGTVMRMRRIEGGIAIPAGGSARFEPGGTHLMLVGPKRRFTEGESVKVTLEFSGAGSVEVNFPVVGAKPRSASADAPHAGHHGGREAAPSGHGAH